MYVEVSNEANVKSISNGYLIDLTVRQADIVTNSKRNYNNDRNVFYKSICSGFISSVSKYGLVKIVFNDIINTNLNISWINNTNTEMYV